jgi:DNA invertase Pin-like site-specific DNA recombinase
MDQAASQKVQARHIRRRAYLYVRQSSMRQVFENTESTKRQYALRQRAIALGWPAEQIIVIDDDQGQSGASANGREGFQRLVAEVGMGNAGIVMGLEVSRLARNSSDWHRLLEICALTDTLILDEDGIYDPAHFNDRLVLGLKGTMSEAELHVLRARLRGGIISKARRGELESPVPVGLVHDERAHVVLDPNARVRETLEYFFESFRRAGSAMGVVKAFRRENVLIPSRIRRGPRRGEIAWTPLTHSRALEILHNPRYAGTYFFGRTRQRRRPDGGSFFVALPREEWISLIPNAHPGYIGWEEFEENQRRLQENSAAHGSERRRSPPREGAALLQGLVLCGRCGERMTVRYHDDKGTQYPSYVCQRRGIENGESICQSIVGATLDAAIGKILVELVTPLSLGVALAVQDEISTKADEADRLRHMEVEHMQYEADLARRRYMQIDPDNRLVADALECEWNDRLRAVQAAREKYEQHKGHACATLEAEERARVLSLATDFPSLWGASSTSTRERKRMVRLLIEDVTLNRDDHVHADIRFRGGSTKSVALPLPAPAWLRRKTDPDVIAEIDALLDHHTRGEIAAILNERGRRSGEGKPFHHLRVWQLEKAYNLRSRHDRLRAAGMLTLEEIAARLSVSTATVKIWRRDGLLTAHAFSDKPEHLFEPPGADAPARYKWKGLSKIHRDRKVMSEKAKEVQCET